MLPSLLGGCSREGEIETKSEYEASEEFKIPARETDTFQLNKTGNKLSFHSKFLGDKELVVLPGVFLPHEAEQMVLPFLKENADRFKDAKVLEIGTGTGIISVYAAELGARKVVATDINERAIKCARRNAERFGYADRIEVRQVPLDDMSAYSVIGDDERFDIIISNPPYSLDLDARGNSAVTDRGDLGFSIVRGLDDHLEEGGCAMLLYASLFYHLVMVKFARHEGFEVRNHTPFFLTTIEAETLFNAYLSRLLEAEGVRAPDIRFDYVKDGLKLARIVDSNDPPPPLFPGNAERWFHGFMVIERPPGGLRKRGG